MTPHPADDFIYWGDFDDTTRMETRALWDQALNGDAESLVRLLQWVQKWEALNGH